MASYIHDLVITTTGHYLPLKFIESIKLNEDAEREVIDKLRDDLTFNIRTASGAEYELSVKQISEAFCEYADRTEVAAAIFERWNWAITNKE